MGLFHSRRSPSSAHRWRLCYGSVRMEEGLPDEVGEEARQGTCFHEVAAECLEFGVDPWPYVGQEITWQETIDDELVTLTRTFTKEMADKMMPGLIQLRAMEDVPGAKMYVEKRVHLTDWVGEGESGTADCFIIDVLNRRIINWDWKWGAGVPVQPEWNDQTILYTLGVWSDYAEEMFGRAIEQAELHGEPEDQFGIEDIEVVICIEQPRAPGGGGTWTTDMATLLEEGRKIKEDAERTEDPDAPLNPGEKQCKFCKAARQNTCKARAAKILALLDQDEDDLETELTVGCEIELPSAISAEARGQILLNRKMIEGFLDQLHDEAMDDARLGKPTPGQKRVLGRRPPRKWKDEARAKLMLEHDFGDEAWSKKLRSPTSVEDELRKPTFKSRYATLVETGDPSPVLVPETDPREPMNAAIDLLDDEADSTATTELTDQSLV